MDKSPRQKCIVMLYERTTSFLSIVSIALLLLLCIIPALNYGAISHSSIIIIHFIAGLIFLSILLQKYINDESSLAKIDISKPLFTLLFIIAIGSFNSIYFFNTQLELHKVITYLIIFIAAAIFLQTEKRLKLLTYWIIGSTTLVAIMGIARYLSIPPFDKLWQRAEFASFVSQNSFHTYISMGLPLALALLFCNIRVYTKILLCPVSFILIASLILSSDKGGWFGLIALMLFLFILLGYEGLLKRKFWFIVLFFILFLWILALFIEFDKVMEKFISIFILNPRDAFNIDYDTTLWNRISIWRSGLKALFRYPFLGVGLGNFRLIYPAFRDETIHNLVRYAHQDYLQFAVETGIIGLLSLLWLGFSFFKKIITRVKFKPSSFFTGLKIGALSGVFSIIFHGLYDFSFHIPSNVVLFVILCGTLMALHLIQYKPKIECKTNIVRLAYLAGSVVIIFYMAYMGRLFIADENYKKGLLAMDRFSFTKAERYLKRALSYVPHNAEYSARLGELYTHRSRFKDNQRFYERKSIDLYRRALSINPYDGNLHVEVAITNARYGRNEEAIEGFRKAIFLDPNNAFYRTMLAQHAVVCGDLDVAEEEFKKALLIKSYKSVK